jgi:hypothetical protein
VWKKAKFNLVSSGNVLTEATYNYQFAGRPPLEVVLATTDHPVKNDTLYFYVVHLKANSGNGDQASYNRRKDAVVTLKNFLDQQRSGQKCIVLGDWNDDVDQSVVYISPSYLESPFLSVVNDSAHYFYATMQLSLAGERSYISYPNMIDHQLMTKTLRDSFYIPASSMVMKQTASQVSGYANNTSDHYPVLARYHFYRELPAPSTGLAFIQPANIRVYPNPASDYLIMDGYTAGITMYLVNTTGTKIPLAVDVSGKISLSGIPAGLYMVMAQQQGLSQLISRLLIQQTN